MFTKFHIWLVLKISHTKIGHDICIEIMVYTLKPLWYIHWYWSYWRTTRTSMTWVLRQNQPCSSMCLIGHVVISTSYQYMFSRDKRSPGLGLGTRLTESSTWTQTWLWTLLGRSTWIWLRTKLDYSTWTQMWWILRVFTKSRSKSNLGNG